MSHLAGAGNHDDEGLEDLYYYLFSSFPLRDLVSGEANWLAMGGRYQLPSVTDSPLARIESFDAHYLKQSQRCSILLASAGREDLLRQGLYSSGGWQVSIRYSRWG